MRRLLLDIAGSESASDDELLVGFFDRPFKIDLVCQDALDNFHQAIRDETTMSTTYVSLADDVAERCDLQARVNSYFVDEALVVSALLDSIESEADNVGRTDVAVVGGSFAAARWKGISQVLPKERVPRMVSIASPLPLGFDFETFALELGQRVDLFWNAVFEGACSPDNCPIDPSYRGCLTDCVRDRLNEVVTERQASIALIGASYDARSNAELLPQLVRESDPEVILEVVDRLEDAVLRQNIFGEVVLDWSTSLVGMCAAGVDANALTSIVSDPNASELSRVYALLYLPCRNIDSFGRAGLLSSDPEPVDARMCLLAGQPDPVLGTALGYRHQDEFFPVEFNTTGTEQWIGAIPVHGSLAVAFHGLETCRHQPVNSELWLERVPTR